MQKSNTPPAERDEWRTPPEVFAWASGQWGAFDVDLAATKENSLCGKNFLSKVNIGIPPKDRALYFVTSGHGFTRGWCNPPYSQKRDFAIGATSSQKLGFSTVMLMPPYDGTLWIDEIVGVSEIINIIGRIAFLKPDGTPVKGNREGSAFWVFDAKKKRKSLPKVSFVHRDEIMITQPLPQHDPYSS